MNKRMIFGVVSMLLLVTFLSAQGYKGQGKVKGIVTDEAGNPIEGVKIILFSQKAQSGFETTTDDRGKWRAFYIRGGTWDMDFEKDGFMPKKIQAQLKEFSKNPDMEIKLTKIEGLVFTDELKEGLKAGNELFDQEKYQEAVSTFQALLEKNPHIYILNRNIGNCYFQMEQYAEAEKYYLLVLEQAPDDHEAKLAIGNTYANRGENEKALEWYDKIDFENISDPLVLFNIGSNFYTQSQYQEALKYYIKAVGIQNDLLDALYQMGLVYLTLGNNQEGIEAFNEYLKYDADSDRATQVKGFIEYLKKFPRA